jgi:hypothetical protein
VFGSKKRIVGRVHILIITFLDSMSLGYEDLVFRDANRRLMVQALITFLDLMPFTDIDLLFRD